MGGPQLVAKTSECLSPALGAVVGKGQMGSALIGVTANDSFFDRGTFGVLPLTYFYLPESAWAHLFRQSVKIHCFCSGPISDDRNSSATKVDGV